ncbi:MAG: DUF1559 domain-containing protein [Pirellulaceae bacterium]|nr:DUF1559 domain-containing protein [Pirellulaceae bacterium]
MIRSPFTHLVRAFSVVSSAVPQNRSGILSSSYRFEHSLLGKHPSPIRNAFTLVELLVSIGIAGILISLLLLGVQSVRESARRAQCSNNLRQMGIAFHNYEASNRCLPPGSGHLGLAPFVAILPYIEQQPLYDSMDLSVEFMWQIQPAYNTRISLYRCPSTLEQQQPRTDYMLNRGTRLDEEGANDPWFFNEKKFPKLAMFSNGANATVLITEHCPRVQGQSKGSLLALPKRFIGTQSDSDRFISECDNADWATPRHGLNNGSVWLGGGKQIVHLIFPPNYKGCANGGFIQSSLYTANSFHSHGVNVLFADSHVEFTPDGIERAVWQKLGIR